MTDERWQRILRIVNEAFGGYLSGMVALRRRIVVDLKRKLRDGDHLDRPNLEQSSRREGPASVARRPRPSGSRHRRG